MQGLTDISLILVRPSKRLNSAQELDIMKTAPVNVFLCYGIYSSNLFDQALPYN